MKVSAPGSICLFGEHQDYMELPVIPCAVSLRLTVTGHHVSSNRVNIELPDLNSSDSFVLDCTEQPYSGTLDYFRSCYNQLLRSGMSFSRGIDCTIESNIPMNAGMSSSSALVVSWIQFLALMSDQRLELPAAEVALLAYLSGAEEFSRYGGMMGRYSSAFGGVIHLVSHGETAVTPLPIFPGEIIIADSGDPGSTQALPETVQGRSEHVLNKMPGVDIHKTELKGIESFPQFFFGDEFSLLMGILRNRDITREALKAENPSEIGKLLTEEHIILRDVLGTSTEKIDGMVDAALNAGAYGAKINGSGGGGCMFATASHETADSVYAALQEKGSRVWKVKPDRGVHIED